MRQSFENSLRGKQKAYLLLGPHVLRVARDAFGMFSHAPAGGTIMREN